MKCSPLPARLRVPRWPLGRRARRRRLNRRALVEAIIGREQAAERVVGRASAGPGRRPCFRFAASRAPKVKDVSFDLRRGEVLGLGGLVGAGRSELARLVFGADRPESGTMTLEGGPFEPRDALTRSRRGRLRAGGAARRWAGPDQERRVQHRHRQSGSLVFSPCLPFIVTVVGRRSARRSSAISRSRRQTSRPPSAN